MLWKIYCWIFAFLSVLGIVGTGIAHAFVGIGIAHVHITIFWLSFVAVNVISTIGVYSYSYEKKIWSQTFWRWYFVYLSLWYAFNYIRGFFIEEIYGIREMDLTNLTYLIIIILMIPQFVAIYRKAGFGKKTKRGRS